MDSAIDEKSTTPGNATIRIACVRLPNLEYSIDVSKTLTVGQFKNILSQDFPLKPKVNEQRLIAMGKQLEDKDHLKDILKESNTATFHLILRNESRQTSSSSTLPALISSNSNSHSENQNRDTIRIHFRCLLLEKEHTETVQLSNTVKELKRMLREKFPSKPDVQDQRLVYENVILNDDSILREIFRNVSTEMPTIDIIITANGINSGLISTPRTTQPTTSTTSTPASAPNLTSPSSSTTGNAVLDELRQRNIPYQVVSVNGVLYALHPKQPPANDSTSAQPDQNQNANPAAPPPAAQAAPLAPAIPDEFGEQHPGRMNTIWLVTKLTILAYLFSQNGGLLRTIFVNISAILIYLFTTGNMQWFHAWIRGRNQVRANQGDDNVNNTDPPTDGNDVVEVPPRSYFQEMKDIIVTFFTSLIPEVVAN